MAVLRLFTTLVLLLLSAGAHAVSVEAEGRALIYNRDLDSARQQAINHAAQQALLQAGAYINSRQRVSDGILMTDHLQVRMKGELQDVRVIDEGVEGDHLWVRIRAEVETDEACLASNAGQIYLKSAALAGFPLATPQQAALGELANASSQIPRQLAQLIGSKQHLRTLDASHLNLHPNVQTASSYQTGIGNLTDVPPAVGDLDVQFLISGVVRDLSLYQPEHDNEGNILRVWYDQLDYLGRQHLRNFALDVFIHDGFTGALLFNRSYRIGGLWDTDRHRKTGFMSPAFLGTDYGQKVRDLLQRIAGDLDQALRCEPFSTRIVSTDGHRITFNAGSVTGIRPGDMLRVYRRSTQYDPHNQPYIRLEDTRNTLVVNEVHPLFATGNLTDTAASLNIQQDDILMAR